MSDEPLSPEEYAKEYEKSQQLRRDEWTSSSSVDALDELRELRAFCEGEHANVRVELKNLSENVLQSALNLVRFADTISKLERMDIDKLNNAAHVLAWFSRRWVAIGGILFTGGIGAFAGELVKKTLGI